MIAPDLADILSRRHLERRAAEASQARKNGHREPIPRKPPLISVNDTLGGVSITAPDISIVWRAPA
jgi:hypothetical protein